MSELCIPVGTNYTNNPKHANHYIQKFYWKNGMNWWKRPAGSPDLNPIIKVEEWCMSSDG